MVQKHLVHNILVILCSMSHVSSVLYMCLCVPTSFVAVGTPVILCGLFGASMVSFVPQDNRGERPHRDSIIQEQHPPRKASKYFCSHLGLLFSPFLPALVSSFSPSLQGKMWPIHTALCLPYRERRLLPEIGPAREELAVLRCPLLPACVLPTGLPPPSSKPQQLPPFSTYSQCTA